MTDKPEALRLAERFEEVLGPSKTTKELRRLWEINQELVEALEAMVEDGWLFCGAEGMSEAQEKVHAALRKARGESHD